MGRKFEDGNFVKREPVRRPIRDQYRDQFFAELGLPRLKDPFAYDPDPASQLELVKALGQKASSIHMGDKQALEMMQREVGMLALSVPLARLAVSALGRPSLSEMTVEARNKSFFHQWIGNSGGDEGG